ncbi:major facilitator superfamily domain-containing protein [Podospora appendiculata]|uniref:Major facilitator superfamily domain-containing protein n=1 Tax=Podospora appendiculata TaxID=314037 RepID=A0AAE0X0E5_9PEZI|nr:major facilitator superfamily domain-containing protein [Podospora appendiculata]
MAADPEKEDEPPVNCSDIDPDTAKKTQMQPSQEPSIIDEATPAGTPPVAAAALLTPAAQPAANGWHFWAIFPPLSISTLLTGLDLTIGSSALPKVSAELDSATTITAFLPLYGQLAQVFGRRWPTIAAVAIFALGSGISGDASSTAIDLVSVRERGKYIGIIHAEFGVGKAIEPPIGGVIAQYMTWRWIFYLNLPICGLRRVDMLTMWRVYFLPVYFQAVLLASPPRSGVLLLPTILIGIPAAIVAGQVLARCGKYRPIHFAGFAVAALASGLYIDLDAGSSLAKVVVYQILVGMGGGCLLTTMLPSVQASHPQTAVAPATATWAFMRSFGNIWGIAVPAAIFNNQFTACVGAISSPAVRAFFGAGDAYSRVSAEYISALPPQLRAEVVDAYRGALRVIWIVCVAFNGLGLLLVFVEEEITLRTTLQSDFALKEAAGWRVADMDAEKNAGALGAIAAGC